jgi:hypothetical protein
MPQVASIWERSVNEELDNLLKQKLTDTQTRLDQLTIAFDDEGEVTARDAQEILVKITAWHRRAVGAAAGASSPQRAEALHLFAAHLEKAFYGFELDFVQQNLLPIVDEVITVIKGSIELWPTLVEICYFQKDRKGLPPTKLHNRPR